MQIKKVSENKRGKIWRIELDRVFFLSFTKEGKYRGGDIHNGVQFNLILEGKGEFRILNPITKQERRIILDKDSFIKIPRGYPHVFKALSDSWMLEWHEKPLPPYEEKQFYKPYRKLVEERGK